MSQDVEIIQCQVCERPNQPLGGYVMLGDNPETLRQYGPLCFDCMDRVLGMTRHPRANQRLEIQVLGQGH